METKRYLFTTLMMLLPLCMFGKNAKITGKITSAEKETIEFASVYLKGTNLGCMTNENGVYELKADEGQYILVVSAIGYETVERNISLKNGETKSMDLKMKPQTTELDEVVIVSNGVSRLKRSAFNAVALDTKAMQNSTQNLSEALAQAPGMKLRESGGYATYDGRIQRKAYQDFHRRCSAGRCGKFVQSE